MCAHRKQGGEGAGEKGSRWWAIATKRDVYGCGGKGMVKKEKSFTTVANRCKGKRGWVKQEVGAMLHSVEAASGCHSGDNSISNSNRHSKLW